MPAVVFFIAGWEELQTASVATCLLKITQSLMRNSLGLLSIQNNYMAPKLAASSL